MALTSDIIIRQAYARIGAYSGDAATINTAYNTGVTGLNTESFPLQSMYDMLAGVENEIATAVASDENNTLRAWMQDTVSIASGQPIPPLGDSGKAIIGVLGQVRNADTDIVLTPGLHEDEIRVINQLPTLFISGYNSYILRPPRILATTSNLQLDVCVFDFDERAAAINGNGALLFPCENAYFDGLMASLKNEDVALTNLSNQFVGPYQQWLAAQRPARDVVSEAAA